MSVGQAMEQLTATTFQISRGAEVQSKDISNVVARANSFAESASYVSIEAAKANESTREIARFAVTGALLPTANSR